MASGNITKVNDFLNVQNTMGTSPYPNDMPMGFRVDLKTGNDIGLSGNIYIVMTIKGWPDTSVSVQQVVLGDDGVFWRRSSGNSWTNFQSL